MPDQQSWTGLTVKQEPTVEQQRAAAAEAHQKTLAFMSQAYEKATAYDNVIMVGGYAAFFALWSGIAHDISRKAALWTVALMLVSLSGYLGFSVWQMVTRSLAQFRHLRLLTSERDPVEIAKRMQAMSEPNKAMAALQSLWIVVVLLTVVTALPAAILLGFNAVEVALGYVGWPT